MRSFFLMTFGAAALALAAVACGDDDEMMRYRCTLEWSCDGVDQESTHERCLDFDAPSPCAELLEQAEASCAGLFTVLEGACSCEGESTSSC